MKRTKPMRRVARNSIFLILQPLILNAVSLFVVGYIAQKLGHSGYGKFTFVFALIAMFSPLANLGLRAITVRGVASDREGAGKLIGRIAALRVVLAVLTILALVVLVNASQYPEDIRTVIYIYSISILFNALNTTLFDVFQGHERMEYVASAQFVSGVAIIVSSVLVLYAGSRLIGLIYVYLAGSALMLLLSAYHFAAHFNVPDVEIDLAFWKDSIVKSMPFFFPTMVSLIGAKTGIILLSRMSGDASVGIYGAANNLVERLSIIPDGICTAIFPAIAATYLASREQAGELFGRFFHYLFILALPLAVGTTILADPIITLVYGKAYLASSNVLCLLIWWLFFVFVNSIQAWSLGAMHLEKKTARISYFSTACNICLSAVLIRRYDEIGAGIACLTAGMISFVLLNRIVRKKLFHGIWRNVLYLKVIAATLIMGAVVGLLREQVIFIPAGAGVVVYAALLFLFGVVTPREAMAVRAVMLDKEGPNLSAAGA